MHILILSINSTTSNGLFQSYLVCLNTLDNTWKFKSSTGMPSNRMPSTRIAAERWMRSEYNGPEPRIRKLIGSPSSDRTKLSTLELVLSLLYYFLTPNYQCLCLNFLCETMYLFYYCHRRYFLTLVNWSDKTNSHVPFMLQSCPNYCCIGHFHTLLL